MITDEQAEKLAVEPANVDAFVTRAWKWIVENIQTNPKTRNEKQPCVFLVRSDRAHGLCYHHDPITLYKMKVPICLVFNNDEHDGEFWNAKMVVHELIHARGRHFHLPIRFTAGKKPYQVSGALAFKHNIRKDIASGYVLKKVVEEVKLI
jgi:hypothetical protein